MPHKHKRRQKDESSYDLPPTVIAKPLPVHKSKQQKPSTKKATTQNAASKPKGASKWADDTPRAFARLMRFQQTGQTPSGLDDGNDKKSKGKKRKRDETQNGAGSSLPAKSTSKVPETVTPKILPGEKLSDFAARVDQAMPLSAMKKSHRTGASETLPKIREDRITKHEKHLRKLQQGWREEEARLRAKEAEERELREAENEELEDTWREALAEAGIDTTKQKKKKKKGQAKKRKKGAKGGIEEDDIGNGTDDDDDDDDPWAKLNTRERAAKPLNPLEVVQAPPESLAKPREIFRVRRGLRGAEVDVANIPATAGSLRRREELAEERKSIVEEYRRLMAAKRGQ